MSEAECNKQNKGACDLEKNTKCAEALYIALEEKNLEIEKLKLRINTLENSKDVNEFSDYTETDSNECNRGSSAEVIFCHCTTSEDNSYERVELTCIRGCINETHDANAGTMVGMNGRYSFTRKSPDSSCHPNQNLLLENHALKDRLQQLVLKLQMSKQATGTCIINPQELKSTQIICKSRSIDNILKRKSSAEKQVAILQSEIKRMNDDIIEKLKNEADQLKREADGYRKQHKQCFRELDKLKQEHANKINALEALLEKVQNTRDKYDELARKCETQRLINENLRSRNISLNQECCFLKTQLIQQKDLNVATQKCFDDFKNAAENLRNCTRQEVFGMSCEKKYQNGEDTCTACIDTKKNTVGCIDNNDLTCNDMDSPNNQCNRYDL